MKKPLCIIPARGGSKRFPRKNIAPLLGKPLLTYVIEAALGSDVFDRVCVSTDDSEIRTVSTAAGAEVLERPEELTKDTARVPHVCTQVLNDFAIEGNAYETFGVILPTSPLVTAQDIRSAYELFIANDAHYVTSVVPYEEPPQAALCVRGAYVERYFSGEDQSKRSQELEPLYWVDGSICFGKTDIFLQGGDFCMSKTVPYFIPREHSSDIDYPIDLAWVAFLLSQR